LWLAQTAAAVHEYQHTLHAHDAPCALHVFADHHDKAPTAKAPTPALDFQPVRAGATLLSSCHRPATFAYRERAPPFLLA
jgi:hypothetical protein